MVGVFESPTNPQPDVGIEAQRAGLEVRAIPCEGRWDRRAIAQIRDIVMEDAVDIIHTHGYKSDVFAYLACRNNGIGNETSLVATCHSWPDPSFLMQLYARLDRLALRRFQAVTTPSPTIGEILRRSGIEERKLTVIGNGVDIKRFCNASPTLREHLAERRKMIGFVGRLVPAKGGQVLIEAARQVLAVYPNVVFVFVGGGPARAEWERQAERCGIAGNVRFTGAVTDMRGVYPSFYATVLPSFSEAMPMALLEAMAASTPVIATAVGATPTVVKSGETGTLCTPGDVDELARGILALLENPERALQLGRNGHALVSRMSSSDVMARNYLEVYERVLQTREGHATAVRELVQ
jgi:glycosyltransferase involved in cell wall biosynthesis